MPDPYRVPSMDEIRALEPNGFLAASTFSGAGGSSLGYRMAGFKVGYANEFIPAARETYAANAMPYTFVDGRDIREVTAKDVLEKLGIKPGALDLFDGSPPCFEAGTPVVAARGVIAIENVVVGDVVLTGEGRWRKVTDVMTRRAPTILVDGRIRTTVDHPFLARAQLKKKGTAFKLGSPEWVHASAISGAFCAVPAKVDPLDVPIVGGRPLKRDAAFWWMVGRWLGDGWLRIYPGEDRPAKERVAMSKTRRPCLQCGKPSRPLTGRGDGTTFTSYCSALCRNRFKRANRKRPRYAVLICSSLGEGRRLEEKLRRVAGLTWTSSKQRATFRFSTSHRQLVEWLTSQFGRGSAGKTIPGWVFGMPDADRRALFDGYLSADGHSFREGMWGFSSVSRNLTVGLRVLATTLGYSTSAMRPRKPTTMIQGRKINAKPSWSVHACAAEDRYTRLDGIHRWQKIRRETAPCSDDVDVFDITVDEDHSFVADAFVVHNCASFSTSGSGSKGWGNVRKYSDTTQRTDDLFFEFVRLVDGIRPKTFVAENVAGLVRGVAVGYFNEVLKLLKGLGYRVGAKLLDAQWLGVPQQRTRIIFVGVREDLGLDPAHPEPFDFRYTLGDACPWMVDGSDGPEPRDGPDIARYAIGPEWEKCREGEQSDRFFNLIRASRTKPSPTILASHGAPGIAGVCHPTEKRKFSIPEVRRVCSFPDDFVLTGSREQQWERMGRAVPPLMMREIGAAIRDRVLVPYRELREARKR